MKKRILIFFIASIISSISFAQSLLSSTISIKAKNQKLHEVLTIIGNESNVTFSYNTKSINRDSLLTVTAVNRPLSEVLRMIFNAGYEFKESGSYIIIRRKPISTSNIVSKSQSKLEYYIINGYVVDDETGEKISDATIYEKQHLISSMTDENGFFSMKLKNKYPTASITVSKDNYNDTSIQIQASYNHKVEIALTKKEVFPTYVSKEKEITDFEDIKTNDKVESKWISTLVLSSKQKIRSLNLKKFYTTRNYQVSVWPGVGTHGKMNAQVVNKFSLNVLGGYAGGLEGFEVGTLFNLIKNDVKGTQLAGLFNIVGGRMKGLQVSSLYNEVADSAKGIQVAGLVNVVKEDMKGIQVASLCNITDKMDGTQVSGLINIAKENMKGIQISSLFNKAKSIKGLQIGFINSTSTQQGMSIGFLNFSKNKIGKRRLAFIVRFPRG